ncbi:MAG: response regulator [Verrucomicrobia bacterium]|nr:response regulator [Verrucomicrobiota bacterium]
MQTTPTVDAAPSSAESALRDAVLALRAILPRLATDGSQTGAAVRRDLAKFAEEAVLFDEEVALWFPVGSVPTTPPGELRERRHDGRNRLNHLFGLAQLIRIGDPAPELGRVLDEAVATLEACLAALSRIGETAGPDAPEPEAHATGMAPEPGSAGTLLIADDDPENRAILGRLLEPRGFRLAFAVNGVETIAKMEREDFDAVLLDLRMPEMDGFEVLSRLRETGRLGNTPVIVVTGLQEEQDAVRCIENGAEDFLPRPIRPALLMARLSASLEKKRLREKVFEQHFTPELARELARNPDPMKMQARQAEVSVMFCDIRGFSAVSERLGPAQTIAWLSGVMGEFSSIVIDHGGVLVDYTGDELLAMWGAPNEQPDHALLACRAALEILERIPELNEQWRPIVGAGTEVGIGINSGEALVGNVGTHRKFKYGPLGNAVNLASRVQGATKFLKTPLLLTGETAGRVRGLIPTRRLCRVRVQNINAPVDLHDLPAPGGPPGWIDLARVYEESLAAFERGAFAEAETRLDGFLSAFPEDGPARGLRARIEAERTGLETEFDPVWSLPGK